MELNESYKQGLMELQRVKNSFRNSVFKRALISNIEQTLQTQKEILGSYIRKSLLIYKDQMDKAFEGMSYIKLEALANRRAQILEPQSTRARGDVKNLKVETSQLFWTFDQEFWADEIGDYVFMLKSECRQ